MEELKIDREFDDLCPPLSDEEERLLEQSILDDGCLHPIITWANHEATILDGHNRYRLCIKHGRQFKTKAIKIESRDAAKEWIIRTQLGRRNLGDSQRAMLAAKMAGLSHGQKKADAPIGASSQAEAAEAFGVGKRTVQRAEKVLEQGSKSLQKAVESGEVSVAAAAAVSELPKAEQNKVVAKGPDAVKEKAKEVKQYKDEFDTVKLEQQKTKPGSEKKSQFKDATIDDLFGKLIRAIDDRWNKSGGHGNNYRICLNKTREAFDAWKAWKRGAA